MSVTDNILYTPICINGGTSNPSSLEQRELYINTSTGILYYGTSSGISVVKPQITSGGSSATGDILLRSSDGSLKYSTNINVDGGLLKVKDNYGNLVLEASTSEVRSYVDLNVSMSIFCDKTMTAAESVQSPQVVSDWARFKHIAVAGGFGTDTPQNHYKDTTVETGQVYFQIISSEE